MRRMINTVAALLVTSVMIAAPEAFAQARRSGGSSTSRSSSSQVTTRGSSSMSRSAGSPSTRRSTASVSPSASRSASASSSRSSYAQTDRTRSTGTTSRSTGSTTSRSTGTTTSRSTGSSTTRSAGTVDQDTRTSRSTGTTSRSTGTTGTSTGSTTSRSTGSTTRSTGTTTSRSTSSSTTRSAGTDATSTRTSGSTGGAVRSTSNVTRSGLGGRTDNVENTSASIHNTEPIRDNSGNYRYNDDLRMDNGHNLQRIPPRERDILAWDRPGHFWEHRPHYFGYRVHVLPPHYRRITHWGIDYYFYEGIYYRPFGGVYVVCRPPFGTPLERAIDRALFNAVRFSYYCNTYRTFNTVFDNYNVIAQQNLIIAQNNARIAAQNASYALNNGRALSAYELANKLGLVQSYAYANSDYFYQDGVFYSVNASGGYTTIVPPAGALVSSLPDDYETIVLSGVEYYMVDNTVYRTILFDGQPYLEVLGQMYGSLYNQYSIYR